MTLCLDPESYDIGKNFEEGWWKSVFLCTLPSLGTYVRSRPWYPSFLSSFTPETLTEAPSSSPSWGMRLRFSSDHRYETYPSYYPNGYPEQNPSLDKRFENRNSMDQE